MHGAAAPLVTSAGRTELLLVSVLVQLIIMVGAARAMNVLFHRLGHPGVVGEIVAHLVQTGTTAHDIDLFDLRRPAFHGAGGQ